MMVYGDKQREKQLRDAFKKAGKTFDMGKSCLRFKTADDLPLAAIGELVASTTPDDMIARAEAARRK